MFFCKTRAKNVSCVGTSRSLCWLCSLLSGGGHQLRAEYSSSWLSVRPSPSICRVFVWPIICRVFGRFLFTPLVGRLLTGTPNQPLSTHCSWLLVLVPQSMLYADRTRMHRKQIPKFQRVLRTSHRWFVVVLQRFNRRVCSKIIVGCRVSISRG